MSSSDLGALRSQVCHQAADWLAAAGDSLWATAHMTQEKDTEAVALLTQMVGQLGQEAADAFDRQRWYAATALTRQIIEAHYLMAVFRDDPKQRPRWLKASTNRIEKSFRPAQMRQVAGVKPGEYKQHCAWGAPEPVRSMAAAESHRPPVPSEHPHRGPCSASDRGNRPAGAGAQVLAGRWRAAVTGFAPSDLRSVAVRRPDVAATQAPGRPRRR